MISGISIGFDRVGDGRATQLGRAVHDQVRLRGINRRVQFLSSGEGDLGAGGQAVDDKIGWNAGFIPIARTCEVPAEIKFEGGVGKYFKRATHAERAFDPKTALATNPQLLVRLDGAIAAHFVIASGQLVSGIGRGGGVAILGRARGPGWLHIRQVDAGVVLEPARLDSGISRSMPANAADDRVWANSE